MPDVPVKLKSRPAGRLFALPEIIAIFAENNAAMTAMQLNNIKLDIIGMVMDTDDEQLLSKVVSCFNSAGDIRPMTMAEYRERIRLDVLRKSVVGPEE